MQQTVNGKTLGIFGKFIGNFWDFGRGQTLVIRQYFFTVIFEENRLE